MADIVHHLRMRASADEVFRALADDGLLPRWWGGCERFSVTKVAETAGLEVCWRCVDGPSEWIGTDITFALARERGDTVVRFAHRNWRDSGDAFAHCATKWARALMAVQSHVETEEAEDLAV